MKLLKVKASHFKNCCDDFTIDFTAKSKKTAEDCEYELQAVAENLYVYNTAAFVGKNASLRYFSITRAIFTAITQNSPLARL